MKKVNFFSKSSIYAFLMLHNLHFMFFFIFFSFVVIFILLLNLFTSTNFIRVFFNNFFICCHIYSTSFILLRQILFESSLICFSFVVTFILPLLFYFNKFYLSLLL